MLFSKFALSLIFVASTIAVALPEPAPAPVEIIVEGETIVEFAEIQCENEHHGLKPICPHLNKTGEHGCIRYVRGFDVTGVVTEVDLTFPEIQGRFFSHHSHPLHMINKISDACDCIQACLNRPTTCAAYVWKFSTPASVTAGHRTCTLYSQFNLPAGVTIEINTASTNNSNINAPELIANGNNPQAGALIAPTFMDVNLNTTVDHHAVSGEVWQLSTGAALC